MTLVELFRFIISRIGEEKMEELLIQIKDQIDVPRKYRITTIERLKVTSK